LSAPIEAPLTLAAQLEARARHADFAGRPFLCHDERTWTYRDFRDESVRAAHFLLGRLGGGPPHVAVLLENQLELMQLYGGCGYAGATLFGLNTGLSGETLRSVVDASGARLLVVDERLYDRVEPLLGRFAHVDERNLLVVPSAGERDFDDEQLLSSCIEREVAKPGEAVDPPTVEVTPDHNLMVIYSSGTTGLPKGINNNHTKLLLIGAVVAKRLELTPDDCGYACMPLFHSNTMFLGVMPAFHVGARVGLRERFSASRFVPDVLRYGVTWWNYVGEPVHYVLSALEQTHGSAESVVREVAGHPDNRLRYALGNGAAAPDIDRFMEWLGLEDMFELYGSTEAAISVFRKKSDPRGSVGEIADPAVKILDEQDRECPPVELDRNGKITNYAEAVGEICRVAPDTAFFQGYFDNPEANAKKYRNGVYHSGDLGHVLARDGVRYLYFDGRTDDWIRKDGENFSAAQVARLFQEHPDVVLAAAYGAPCAVSDELVMVALKLREGARFDRQELFDFCERQVTLGGMDRKWFPDFVRIVDEFSYTETQKVLVRHLKREHFDRRRLPDAPLYWRERGDTTYRPFGAEDFAQLRERFVERERADLLDH
jgi:fatty-acyl-CoA synthase